MRILLLISGVILAMSVSGQASVKDSVLLIPFFSGHVSYQEPAGDLAERYGANGTAGGSFMVKNRKGFLFGIEGSFIFGNRIVEKGILEHLESQSGFIISRSGLAMDVFLLQRGFQFFGKVGYRFPFLAYNPNSGPFVTVGAGFWQHRLRLEEKYGESPSLSEEYKKGYDRLTNGFALNQMVGYHLFSDKRLINFYVAAELTEGFLQGRRNILFDTGQPGTDKRFDMTAGVRFGWVIPIYERRKSATNYYYY